MNKIHNIVWSKARGAWVVVAEGTKAASKAGGSSLKVMIALIMLSPVAGHAADLPQGGSISVGQGTITTNGSNQMVIKQTTDKLGINWKSFNVGADGHVVFDQPGTHSVALNRVIGSDGSSILGRIDANGQVVLINPNGVIFGKDSKVNVGGLVASTLNMSDADFKSGNYTFKAGAASGEVTNQGSLQAAEGGYVALIGKSVKNNGVIQAKLGSAALAAGSAVTLDFSGDSLINIQVTDSAIKAQVENNGLIKADGGSVLMTARASNALLDTVVNNEGIIEAKTIENKSGKIFLDGGFDGGTVSVAGTLDASAPASGNGGFIETSGKNLSISDRVHVSTLSATGATGEWLVDPTDFYIVAGTGAKTLNSIGATTLANSLASSNVTLSTSGGYTDGQLGDLNVNADVAWSGNTKLTLSANNNVNINAKITVNGATGGIVLNPSGRVNTTPTGSVKLKGANSTYTENGNSYQVIRNLEDLKQLGLSTASYKKFVLGADIDASDMTNWNGGQGWMPYGEYYTNYTSVFGTTFNGLGNTISNFYINRPGQRYMGLFGVFYNGTLSNLNITGNVVGGENTGMLAGQLYSDTVFNVNVSGTVKGSRYTGGVVGYAYSNKLLNNLVSSVNVTGAGDDTGGVIGYSYSNTKLDLLRFNGSVVGGYYVGGIIGESNADTEYNDFSTSALSSVAGNYYVGGAVGSMPGGTAKNISTSGSVTGKNTVGGVFGYTTAAVSYLKSSASVKGETKVGGLIGEINYSRLNSSYATGKVNGTGDSIGGLIGSSEGLKMYDSLSTGEVIGKNDVGGLIGTSNSDQIDTSFSTSKVSGSQNVGGFIGSARQSIITDAYATGEVSADTENSGGFVGKSYYTNYKRNYSTGKNSSSSSVGKGGFVGAIEGDVFTSSYWDKDKSGMSTSAGGAIGKTTAELSQASTYVGWGISTSRPSEYAFWRIYEGSSTPLLQFLMATADVSQNDIVTTYTGTAQAPSAPGQINLSNVQVKSFYASLIDLTTAGLKGGGFTGAPAMINAGTYTATSALSSGQFGLNLNQVAYGKFIINKAALYFDATASGKVYDATTNASASLSAKGLGSDVLTVTGYDAKFSDKNAGVGKTVNITGISISGAAASNYMWSSLTATADIAKADLTITATGVNKTYDGTTAGSVTLSDNRLGSDSLAITSNAAFADKNAGSGKLLGVTSIMVSGADAANYNYNTSTTATADVAKAALVVGAVGQDKVYDGSTGASLNFTDNRKGLDDLSISASGLFSDKNAGNGKTINVSGINVAGADAGNYAWNNTAITTANITKASLVISAVGVDKVYDGSTSASAILSDNRAAGDDLAIGSSVSFSDKNAGNGKAVTVGGLSVTGADAANYSWNSFALTSADITKANLLVGAVASNKVYDGSSSAVVSTVDNRVAGDDLAIGSSASFSDKNAGSGKSVSVTGISVTGADAGNYTWNTSASTIADIAKANLAVAAAGVNKIYDGLTAAGVTLSDNRIGSDLLVVSSSGAAFADKNAGNNKAISVSGINVSGADAANYTWNSSAITTAKIDKASLVVTAAGINKTFDGTTDATVALSDNRVAGDALVIGSRSSFEDKNAGAGKIVHVGDIVLSGADAGNYTANTFTSATADIAKAALVVKAENGAKVIGDPDSQLKWSLQNGSLFGSDSLSGGLDRNPGEEVGLYGITRGNLSAGSNYALSVVPGVFEIKQLAKPVKPKADLEEAKDVVATVSIATKVTSTKSEPVVAAKNDAASAIGDYRLLNLGMKLPDDIVPDDKSQL